MSPASRSVLLALAAASLLFASGCAHHGGARESAAVADGVLIASAEAPQPTVAQAPEMSEPQATTADTDVAETVNPADVAMTSAPDATLTDEAQTTSADLPAQTEVAIDEDAQAEPLAYDPVADPNLPTPAEMPTSYDPWERFNRRMHRFNEGVDRRIAKPLATAYIRVVPRPVRLGVGNFFNNLGQPVSALNALLQGKPKQAGQSLGRFLMNSTLGIGGLFDPASAAKIPNKNEDFGQTLGVWGWKKSRYVELPLFGPRTVRDVLGLFGDAPMSPVRPIQEDKVRVFLQGLQLVNVRAQLMSVDSLREGAADDYSLVRDAWLQRRDYQILGDSKKNTDATLPDYLLEGDDAPTVPVDAMPVIPGTP